MRIEAIGCEPLQLRRVHLENSRSLDVYRRNGGYEAIKKVLDGMFSPLSRHAMNARWNQACEAMEKYLEAKDNGEE